jgi:hypothetical protein
LDPKPFDSGVLVAPTARAASPAPKYTSCVFSGDAVSSAFTNWNTVAQQKKDGTPEHATREEVEQAVVSLSPADRVRLEKFARYKMRGLGRRAANRDHEDLLREAISSTWIGAGDTNEGRRWRKKEVTFCAHVLGAMRSIASHWKEASDDDEAYLDSELTVESENGEVLSPVENAPSAAAGPERTLSAKEQLGVIYRLFQNDDDAALVLEGIREDWSGPEIMEQLGLPQNRYEAALKRIRYRLK